MKYKAFPMITQIERKTINSESGPITVEYISSLEDKKNEVERFVRSAPYLNGLLPLFDNKLHKKILIVCDDINFGISAAHKSTSCMGSNKSKADFYEMDFSLDDFDDDILIDNDGEDLIDDYELDTFPIIWESKLDPSTNYTGETNLGERDSMSRTPINYINPDKLILIADGVFPLTSKTIDYIRSFEDKLIVVVPSRTLNEKVINNLVFECDFDLVQVKSPSIEYLENMLRKVASQMGYRICDSIDLRSLIIELKSYRTNRFCEADILIYLNKAIKEIPSDSKSINSFPKLGRKTCIDSKPFDGIVGLDSIKNKIYSQIHKFTHLQEMSLAGYGRHPYYKHMAFEGNPGTCKTSMARAASILFREHGIITNGFFEFGREDIVGRYVGETSLKVKRIFEMANGGVIFIDEIGSLITAGSMDSFGEEALNSIVRYMENDPETIVIFATYPDEMKKVIDTNPGLQSRISEIIDFPDYSPIELVNIFKSISVTRGYTLELSMDEVIIEYFKKQIGTANFGNGREARKLFEASVTHLSLELAFNDSRTLNKMTLSAVQKAISEICGRSDTLRKRPLGFETGREVF